MLQTVRRQLVVADDTLPSDHAYAVIIGASVCVLSTLLIVVGLVFYCKERKRNKELVLEPWVDLTSTFPTSQLSPGMTTATTRTLFNNFSELECTQSTGTHNRFYVMTSPINTHLAPSAELKHSTGTSDSSSQQSASYDPIEQKFDGFGRSCGDTEDLDSFNSSTTHSRIWSIGSRESFNSAGKYVDRTSSSDPSANTNSKSIDSMGSSSRHRGLWHDPAIVAVRIPMDKLTIGAVVSRGGFGEVLRGTYKNRDVAIKRLLPETRKDLTKIDEFLAEVKLQAALEHERVVQFIGVAWDSLTDLCGVSEFIDGGDLRGLLIQFDDVDHRPMGFDAEKARIALDVAHALTYLHCLDPVVLHRDLKSKNILLDSNRRAKLTDFGVSRERSDRTMTGGVGTSLWMAPEVMLGERYDEKADVFSFGIVLSELDSHKLPYAGAKITETGRVLPNTAILQLVSCDKLRVSFTPPSSRAWEAMVQLGTKCVAFEPDERPTASQALYQIQLLVRAFTQTGTGE
uniref:Protein kinase domain-containing protein n=1 Tax=Hyaloperonospora arabidopsidis (strain Emoy2) TaxID=559515 RepID=M4B5X9_HYAAE